MNLIAVWLWECLENLPLLFGFVVAARLWRENIPAGVTVLVTGMGFGVLISRLVEPKLHKTKHEVRWVSMLVNFVLFVGLAIPFIYYFRAETRRLNWGTDLLGGLAVGLFVTFVQGLHWTGPKARMVLHGLAMMVAFPVIMLGLRSIINMDDWGLSMFFTFLLTLFSSLIIALIDYQEMYVKRK